MAARTARPMNGLTQPRRLLFGGLRAAGAGRCGGSGAAGRRVGAVRAAYRLEFAPGRCPGLSKYCPRRLAPIAPSNAGSAVVLGNSVMTRFAHVPRFAAGIRGACARNQPVS